MAVSQSALTVLRHPAFSICSTSGCRSPTPILEVRDFELSTVEAWEHETAVMADIEATSGSDSPPMDPDAQHTVTDFLDYTEYLPSDLLRSLTLIGKLDESYVGAVEEVHGLSKEYGLLPTTSPKNGSIARAQALRQLTSHNLDYAISCREASYGEASRLYEMIDRHYNRLTNIISKLHALPKPPSRDPTPVLRSPQVTRTPAPRITLRLDNAHARAVASANRGSAQPPKSHRSRKITVPGEVLPPPNPDSPPPFTDSDWESNPPSPIPMPTSRVGGSRKPPRIRPPKAPKLPKLKLPKTPRPPRPPGAVGTNVHSQVAGISTSNALSLLTPPPEDAKPGSRHAPWMRLTEWEMAKLRKRMKKNAIWTPSETMIRRELSLAGRGPDNYRKTRAQAEANGEDFLDEDNIASAQPGKPLLPGEISADSLGLLETNLENRGMKLNEAKKMKREVLAKERAAELESEAQKLGSLGSRFKDLFPKPSALPLTSPVVSASPSQSKGLPKKKLDQKDKSKQTQKSSQSEKPTPANKATKADKIIPANGPPQADKPSQTEKPSQTTEPDQIEKPQEATKTLAKKRKREEPLKLEIPTKHTETAITTSINSSKKRKTEVPQSAPLSGNTTITTNTVTTTVPLAAPAPSPKNVPKPSPVPIPTMPATPIMAAPEKPKPSTAPKVTATSSRPRRVSLTLKGPAEPPPEPIQHSPRTATRASSRRSSVNGPPSATIANEHPRRKSTTPAPPPASPATVMTAAGRRSKRPAPGPVVKSDDGGAAISMGKRQHAPAKRGTRSAAQDNNTKDKENASKPEDVMYIEDIDPNEPRYCICGNVSWGDMVECENPNVSSSLGSTQMNSIDMLSTVRRIVVPFLVCGLDRKSAEEEQVVLPRLQR